MTKFKALSSASLCDCVIKWLPIVDPIKVMTGWCKQNFNTQIHKGLMHHKFCTLSLPRTHFCLRIRGHSGTSGYSTTPHPWRQEVGLIILSPDGWEYPTLVFLSASPVRVCKEEALGTFLLYPTGCFSSVPLFLYCHLTSLITKYDCCDSFWTHRWQKFNSGHTSRYLARGCWNCLSGSLEILLEEAQ